MPRNTKTVLKNNYKQAELFPFEVHASGDPFNVSGDIPSTVPLPNDVIITSIEGSYTEQDRKLWAFLVAAVWDDLLTTRIHEMRVSKINAVFQGSSSGKHESSSWIWDSVKRLNRTHVEWQGGVDGARLKGISNMMNAVLSEQARASGWLRFEIPALLCEVIRAPCRFSRLRLHFMLGLSGKYAVTLYMILETVANLKTPVLDVQVDQLRQWLKIPDGKLEKWFDIKRRAIEPALQQINDNPETAGFSVVMEEIKEGRAVDRVRFILTKSAQRIEDEKRLQQDDKKPVPPVVSIGSSLPLHFPTHVIEAGKKAAPGLDIYALENDYRRSMAGKSAPDNLAGHFVGFCKKVYKEKRHTLKG